MEMIEQPGHLPEHIRKGEPYRYLVATRDFPLLNRVVLPMVLKCVPYECKRGAYHQTYKRLHINGRHGITEVLFLSGKDPETWGGLSANRAWLDEFAQLKEELFNEVQTRLIDRKGKMVLTGTPRGPNWAYHRLYKPSKEGTDERIKFFHWKTFQNPYLVLEDIEKARRHLPPRYFKRAFEASWDAFTGQVYDDFAMEIHVKNEDYFQFQTSARDPVGPPAGKKIYLKKVIAGVDWGFHEPGVIQVMGQRADGMWFALETMHETDVLVTARGNNDCWVKRAQALRKKWGIQHFYCDPSEPEYIEQFQIAGLPAEKALAEREPGIQLVASLIRVDEVTNEPRLWIMDKSCKALLDELPFYHYAENGKPVEKNDHSCDAIRYALYTDHIDGQFTYERDYHPRRHVIAKRNF